MTETIANIMVYHICYKYWYIVNKNMYKLQYYFMELRQMLLGALKSYA